MAGQRRRRRGRARPRGRTATVAPLAALGLAALGLAALGCGAGYAAWDFHHAGSDAALSADLSATAPPWSGPADTPDDSAAPDGAAGGPTTGPTNAPTTGPSRTATPPGGVPQSGTGRFRTAQADGRASGHGRVRRYTVEVEGGIALSPRAAAHEIAGILADPRGWTANGRDAFQLVSSGPADFVVKIATPDTVDALCGEAGLLTRGEVNCDVGATVVVNLKRWMLGSPEFSGPIHDYRALIVNHEVGHRIGHGHEGCPGSGRPAPVMMQQIKGLHGCVANQWPYDSHGRYLQGPPA